MALITAPMDPGHPKTYIIKESTCSLTSVINVIGLRKIAMVPRKIFLQIQQSIANVQIFLNLAIDALN
jgi:hypothetical protein